MIACHRRSPRCSRSKALKLVRRHGRGAKHLRFEDDFGHEP
jgi:hypothetical protein